MTQLFGVAVDTAVRSLSVTLPPGILRLHRQLEGIDLWHAERERLLQSLADAPGASSASRELRVDASRRREGIQRIDEVVKARAGAPPSEPGAWSPTRLTAVVAHPHEWYAGKLAAFLGASDVLVVECTGNGADALGAVIVEQPDLLVVHETLAMLTGAQLLELQQPLAPSTVAVGHSISESGDAELLGAGARAVCCRSTPPDLLVTQLLDLLPTTT